MRRDESRAEALRAQHQEDRAAELRRQAREVLEREPLLVKGINEAVARRITIDHRVRAHSRAEELIKQAQELEGQAKTRRQLATMAARSSSIFDRLEERTREHLAMDRRRAMARNSLSPVSDSLLLSWPREGE